MPNIAENQVIPLKGHSKKRNLFLLITGIAVLLIAGYFGYTLLIFPGVLPQQAINLLPDVPIPQSGQKVLVFSPHPDDETIATGGYIIQAIQQGAEVRIVLVTNGNKHGNEAVRYNEFKKATAILGVNESDLVFMGLPDGGLSEIGETTLYQLLKDQVDSYSPNVIVYPAHQDFHPDHAAVGKQTDKIVTGNSSVVSYTYLVHYGLYYPRPKQLAPTLYLLPATRLVRFGNTWQKVILPQPVELIKQDAVYAYQSQLADPVLKALLLSYIRQNELLMAY